MKKALIENTLAVLLVAGICGFTIGAFVKHYPAMIAGAVLMALPYLYAKYICKE